jgi:hypothetical protein
MLVNYVEYVQLDIMRRKQNSSIAYRFPLFGDSGKHEVEDTAIYGY